jgi:cephalosporin hydroxylase
MVPGIGRLQAIARWAEYRVYSRRRRAFSEDLSFSQATRKFADRNALHAYMHHYLHHLAPPEIRGHRRYYKQGLRGFGEDALHAMWWTLLTEFRPRLVLEIGVYRGQVLSLWGLIAKLSGFSCEVHGISPFSPAGDGASRYLEDVNYYEDTLTSNRMFGLPEPKLVRAFSTEASALEHIMSHRWDLAYIDGNHDFEVAVADYKVCRDALEDGGLLVMDDSSLYTAYRPRAFSFAGHPGPSRVVNEFAMKELQFLGGVGHNNVFRKG